MSKKLLSGIEQAESEVSRAGQVARNLLRRHRALATATHRLRLVTEYHRTTGEPVMGLEVWAEDGAGFRAWVAVLGALDQVKARAAWGDAVDLTARTTVGGVPVTVWAILHDEDEVARYLPAPAAAGSGEG